MSWFFIAVTSSLLSAISTLFEKKAICKLNPLNFSLLLAMSLLIPSIIVISNENLAGKSINVQQLLLAEGLVSSVGFFLVMVALQKSDISVALPLLGLTPGVSALLDYFVRGESISHHNIAALCVMTLGVGLLEWNETGRFKLKFNSSLHIWGAVLLFALASVLEKELVTNFQLQPFVILAYQNIFSFIFYSILFFITLRGKPIVNTGINLSALGLVLVVALLTLGYRYTELCAMKSGPMPVVLSVKRTSIFFASLIGGKLFKEEEFVKRLAAASLIVAAGILIVHG